MRGMAYSDLSAHRQIYPLQLQLLLDWCRAGHKAAQDQLNRVESAKVAADQRRAAFCRTGLKMLDTELSIVYEQLNNVRCTMQYTQPGVS